MIDEELVQLLTPEGERVENSEYESTLNGDEIFGFYRDMVIIRRLCNESTSLQRQGQLALWAPIQGHDAAALARRVIDIEPAGRHGRRQPRPSSKPSVS